MAGRPTKAGLDYFELDCHMEEKVRLIQAEFGLKGFAVLVKLYQKIYGGFGTTVNGLQTRCCSLCRRTVYRVTIKI